MPPLRVTGRQALDEFKRLAPNAYRVNRIDRLSRSIRVNRFCCAKVLDIRRVKHYIATHARRGAEQQTKEMKMEKFFAGSDFEKAAQEAARALISGWTPEQVEEGRKTAQEWDASDRQQRAWSSPVAARYGQDWEFFVKAHLIELNQEPDEVRDLRPLLRA